MPSLLEDLGGQIAHARGEIADLFKKKNDKGEFDWSPEDLDNYKGLEKKVNDLQPRYNKQAELESAEDANRKSLDDLKKPIRNHFFPGATSAPSGADYWAAFEAAQGAPSASESLAKSVVESDHFKKHFSSQNPVKIKLPDFDTAGLVSERKATMTTTAGFPPFSARGNVRVPFALRRPTVGDLITQNPTNQSSIVFMQETTFTNNAAPVAEAAAKPESASAWTQVTVPIEVIATILPVTEQQLEDVEGIMEIINQRLGTMIMLAEENQFLNGTGTSPQLHGILTESGVQTYAQGTDNADEEIADAILSAMTLVRTVGFAEPSGIVMSPADFKKVRLLKTADGMYIFGAPSEVGPGTIWGLDPVVTTAMTAGTALVGAFNNPIYIHISRKKGITVDVGYINDNFARNMRTIRAETRVSQEIGRPAAFAKVTSLN